jgi:choline dehydrogenase
MAVALITPLSRGTVDIGSADSADPPLINPNWLTHPTDQAVVVAGYKRARQIMQTNAMKKITIGDEYFPGPERHVETDEQILQFIRESFNTVFHASSTCSMGKTEEPNAVVDSHARVIGVQNLRLVDASVFPFLPPGHPQATVCEFTESPYPPHDMSFYVHND